jgi:hypothetical protein
MEGDELRTTDDVLLEEGTGSAADNVDFLTVWGYTVPAGYMFSKHEDGIRTYASAGLYSNDKTGDDTTSYTGDVTVKNCTIKRMRSGYSFAFGSGDIRIEDSQALECESGFSIKSNGVIKNCSADAKYGAVYGNAYNSDKNVTADITILNSEGGYGPHELAYIGGSNHNIIFKGEDSVVDGKSIQLAGDKKSMRMLNGVNSSQTRHNSKSNTIANYTGYPLILDAGTATYGGETYSWNASNNNIETCGNSQITDNGSGNSVTVVDCSLSNLALDGVASQSTTDYGGLPEYANDGNTDGNFGNGSVTHTERGVDGSGTLKWWQVDLQKDYTIKSITLFNRTGSNYGERLNNFTVDVVDSEGNITFTRLFEDSPNPSITISTGTVIGRVVKISKTSDYGLSLAEVQVFGVETALSNDKIEKANNVEIFPNPVEDVFIIANSHGAIIEIFNNVGVLMFKDEIKSSSEFIDISSFNSGLYFIRIINNGLALSKKIIKK